MKKTISLTFLTLILSVGVFAQDYEYGKTSELKGLTKFYINVGADIDNFNRIRDVIEKSGIKELQIVGTIDEAEFTLMFHGGSEVEETAISQKIYGTDTTTTQIVKKKIAAGRAAIVMPSADRRRLRILMNYESSQNKIGEKKPATKFAKKFIEEYKKANGLK